MIESNHYLVYNNCYKSGKRLERVSGVLIHDTATPGATIDRFLTSWNVPKPNRQSVCVHAFCDDVRVVNTLPHNIQCWGCGSGINGSGNRSYIQIEMCVPSSIYIDKGWHYLFKPERKDEALMYIKNLVEVVTDWAAQVLFNNNIHVVNNRTVTSHYEAHKMGLASNHGDPAGLLGLAGLSMDYVRERIRVKLACLTGNNTSSLVGKAVKLTPDAVQYDGDPIRPDFINKEYIVDSIKDDRAVLTIDNMIIYAVNTKYISLTSEISSFLVKVNADVLNIRREPNITSDVVGKIRDHGVYTIVATSGSWGLLKSGAGWISLAYTKRLI